MGLENKPLEANGLIKFVSGPLNGKVFPLNKLTLEIGRDAINDIVVFDPKVSRQHARIRWEQGKWLIENLSQKSVITINQRRIQLAPLVPNTVVQLGDDTSFVFLQTQPGQTPPPAFGPGAPVPASPSFVQQPTPPPQAYVP